HSFPTRNIVSLPSAERVNVTLLTLALLCSSSMAAPTWTLEVIYPDHEIKNFTVLPGKQPIVLRNSNWKCFVSPESNPVLEEYQFFSRGIVCNKGVDLISTDLLCADIMKDVHTTLSIGDIKRGGGDHTMGLKCNATK